MAFGAESHFIEIQRYQIKHWCPVCLSIAACVGLAATCIFVPYVKELIYAIQKHNKDAIMDHLKSASTFVLFVFIGFLIAFFGTTKIDAAEVAIEEIKNKIAFGSHGSPIEMYIVTDWFCSSCNKLEPVIEKIVAKVYPKAAIYFIDYSIHKNSLNFVPYNISFMINSKNQYFLARRALAELGGKNENPTDEDVAAVAQKYQIPFRELPYKDIKAGMDYFDKIVSKYDLDSTPTVLIVNTKNNKVVKMEGRDEISEEKIIKAIDSMKS